MNQKNNDPEDIITARHIRNRKAKKTKNKSKTGAHIGKTVVSAVLLITMGYGLHAGVDHIKQYHHISNLIKNYQEENACLLPTNATTNLSYDMEICSGQKFVSTINWLDIEYCRINDEYYTKDGIDVAVIDIEVIRRDTKSSLAINSSSGKVYAAPDGYVIIGEDCYKDEKEVITRVIPKRSDYNGITETIKDAENAQIINIREVSTKKFSEITDMTLICDVIDSPELDQTGNYPGTLKLVP